MDCRRASAILLLVFFGIISLPADAQVNLKVGYNLSILSNPGLDRIISSFNQSQNYTDPIHNLRFLHGFEGGFRFKEGVHALEITYQGDYRTFKAKGQFPGTVDEYSDKLKYSIQSGAIGYQLASGPLGFGTDLQYQMYTVKLIRGQTGDSFKNLQHMIAFKVYLNLTLKGDNGIDLAFQPYMILPTKEYDLNPLANILGTENAAGKEKWTRFGLTMLFYNGEK